MFALLLALTAFADDVTSGLELELTRPSVYVGKGAETGIPGIVPSAQVYEFEVRATFDLTDLPAESPEAFRDQAFRWFDTVSRDYSYYPYVSPLIREAWGRRVDPGQPPLTALAFLQELVSAESEGRPILTERRVTQLAGEIADGYALEHGALSACPADTRAWLWEVSGDARPASARTPEALTQVIGAMSGEALRERMKAVSPRGCERAEPRDYLFMAFGVPSGAPGGWIIAELDFTDGPSRAASLSANERYYPSIEVAGPVNFFDGRYRLRADPKARTLEITYGYRMDLSLWPERIVTRYHERVIVDFVHALHERFVELREAGSAP